MTKEQINAVLDAIRSWPREGQEELVDIARAIEARRSGVYSMTEEERAAVRQGLSEADRGEFVSDEDMEAFWKRNRG